MVADLAEQDQARDVVRHATARYGRVDILINNAAILGPRVSLLEYPAA